MAIAGGFGAAGGFVLPALAGLLLAVPLAVLTARPGSRVTTAALRPEDLRPSVG